MILAWLVVSRWKRLYATPAAAVVAALLIGFGGSGEGLALSALTPQWVWTTPVFSLDAIVSLALPLFIVTMASQNLPGLAVLSAYHYRPEPGPLVATTGAFTLLAAPFGGHAVNLSAITAALCASPDASPDPAKRWIAAATAGAAYVVFGLLAGGVTHFVSGSPILVEAVAGLALLNAFGAALHNALADASEREAALATFLVSASGVGFYGIGGAFWGLLAGGAILVLTQGRRHGRARRGEGGLSGLAARSRRVEPIVALEQALRSERAHRQVARQGEGAAHVVDAALRERVALHARRARDAIAGIGGERLGDVGGFGEAPRERVGVLDRLRRALGEKRRHRMRGVAEQRDRPERKMRDRRANEKRPGPPIGGGADERARLARPIAKRPVEGGAVGDAVPGVVALFAAPCRIRSPRRG